MPHKNYSSPSRRRRNKKGKRSETFRKYGKNTARGARFQLKNQSKKPQKNHIFSLKSKK